MLSHFSHVWLCATHRWQPTRLHRPWDSPGKNTGVGCHFLLWCMKVKNESEVAQLCLIPSDSMDCSLPGSSVHGIFQARVLEWGAMGTHRTQLSHAQSSDPWCCELKKKKYCLGFPGSSVIKNPPANVGDKSLIPERVAEQPNLCITTTEPVL